MILYHWRGHAPNFGDELNTLLWPALLPDFFDGEPATRLLGIGSVLDSRHPPQATKVVAGAGYAGYERKPLLDESWIIHWVRGPLTAAVLGLPADLALGDPAMLLPLAMPCPVPRYSVPQHSVPRRPVVRRLPDVSFPAASFPTAPFPGGPFPGGPFPGGPVAGAQPAVGFMPHFESLQRGPWDRAAGMAGVTLIDPREPPQAVMAAIARCDVLLSESLHGAIIADALRIPWVPLRPLAAIHRDKWHDWAATLDVTLRSEHLPATCGAEWLTVRGFCQRHRIRRLLSRHRDELNGLWPNRFLDMAAQALQRAATAEAHLSSDTALDRAQSRMLDAVTRLRCDPMRRAHRRSSVSVAGTGLHRLNKSEYQLRPVG
ncbi:polysaccharide pyruvyl transferase family protein [Rhodopila sp.]|uniref:polysaccharide pyruvyl transferase family protein n=1 Tax=Rhodopila sp. TaxID=2480087 RepID=UPI002B889AB3|nr:polysaccharide pyruvyl transferase family protein [Rhodopila sp.]HVZ06370.1 polysaccharide pyruvyl transferase family protein [Rhodopila sp.]